MRKGRWRHWFRVVHRDLGYVAVSLTIAYALSGIAVNHIEDWNPNYKLDERSVDLGPLPAGSLPELEAFVVAGLGLDPRTVRGHFQETATDLRVFLADGQEARVDIRTGHGTLKTLSKRAVFFEVNALHLNNLKGIWTYIADAFALALVVLALTGMTMMKGDRGFLGRGKYFVGAGLLVPISFVIYLYA
ncbi:MAG: PepSY-associated TM helix domain-containing protein [Deltaproteobacteria bacterium]|nr:PepSY-associated TM helix domain-containing protein [Deltaproteobacteria bacterium]